MSQVYPTQRPYDTRPPEPSYAPAHHTTVVVQQPQSQKAPLRTWSSGLCGCFDDCGICFMGWCCPCILGCQTASDMGESSCLPCCVPAYQTHLRTKLRTMENIEGSIMKDCCIGACCYPLDLCQLAREVKYVRSMGRPVA